MDNVFSYEGNKYRKVIYNGKHSTSCNVCITTTNSRLCHAAGNCEGKILKKHMSFIESFKQL
jgi:hypothetical protein